MTKYTVMEVDISRRSSVIIFVFLLSVLGGPIKATTRWRSAGVGDLPKPAPTILNDIVALGKHFGFYPASKEKSMGSL